MLTNLASERDPQNWDDYFFHEKEIKDLRTFLETDTFPFALTFSGFTGSGKTLAVRLFIKALFCERRQPGESHPCGECHSCKQDPRVNGSLSNVIWVQRGQDETLSRQVNNALQEAYQPPNGFDEDHRNYKVIVFDEAQSIPKDKLQDLLFYPELPYLVQRNRVIFIFITMNEKGISSSVAKPLLDRTFYLKFRQLSEPEIIKYLKKQFPYIPNESAEIIAHYSHGSVRSALSGTQRVLMRDKYLGVETTADTLYYTTVNMRQRIWSMLKHFDMAEFRQYWQLIEVSIEPEVLMTQMLNDLDTAMIVRPTLDQLKAHALLCHYLSSPTRIRAYDVLKGLTGLDLVQEVQAHPLEQTSYERVINPVSDPNNVIRHYS